MTITLAANSISPVFRAATDLDDVLSVVLRCPEDKTWLIGFDQAVGLHVPFVPTRGVSWGQKLSSFLKEYVNLPTTQKYGNLWRIIRIWRNENDGFLTNAIFDVVVTPELKKKLTISKNNKGIDRAGWLKEHELEAAAKTKSLIAPDMLLYVPCLSDSNYSLEAYTNCAVMESSNLIEVPRELIVPGTNTCLYDLLVEGIEFKPQHISVLYAEFLTLTFPYIIMGQSGLDRFATLAGWNEKLWKTLMKGTDLTDKGGLSFKELLYLICLVEPGYTPTGPPAEARARLIFRCFDSNRSQKLSPKEFSDFIACLRSYQSNSSTITLDKDIEQGMRALDLKKGSEVPIQHFLQATSMNRLKGFNSMLKSRNSLITSYISNATKKAESLGNAVDGKKSELFLEDEMQGYEYKLSSHLAKVMHGRFNESIPLDKQEGVWSPPRPRRLSRSLSDDLQVGSHACNQVLLLLKYFTSPYCVPDPKAQEKPKKRFDWESFAEFETFARHTITVSEEVTKIFEGEQRLLTLESPIYVFGDIHGNIRDITCFDRYMWPLGIGLLGAKVLFLGDYVDRGSCGIEVVAFLFAQKIRAPNQVYLLRGNHEVRSIQKNFTFFDECVRRCGEELGVHVWEAVNKAFDCMPLAALIDKKLFCCHGGIPPPWNCPTIHFIKSIPRVLPQPEKNAIAWNLMWNDPVRENQIGESLQMELLANNGFAKNRKRGTGCVFDTSALERFLTINNLSYVIRAHEAQVQGFQIHHKGKIITVFSSSFYNGGSNSAACILVKLGRLKLIQINTNEYHV